MKELRDLVRLGVAEDYTNKPSEYIYTLRRLEKVAYSTGVYGINGGLVQDTDSRVDTTALKKELPEIAARYTKTTTARRFTFA